MSWVNNDLRTIPNPLILRSRRMSEEVPAYYSLQMNTDECSCKSALFRQWRVSLRRNRGPQPAAAMECRPPRAIDAKEKHRHFRLYKWTLTNHRQGRMLLGQLSLLPEHHQGQIVCRRTVVHPPLNGLHQFLKDNRRRFLPDRKQIPRNRVSPNSSPAGLLASVIPSL